jgi:hypothetical protein
MTKYTQQYYDDLATTEAMLESEGFRALTNAGIEQSDRRYRRHNESLSTYRPDTVAESSISELMDNKWPEVERGAMRINCSVEEVDYLRYRLLGMSYSDIGKLYGGLDHTTISRSVKRTYQRVVNAYPYMGLIEILAEACGVSPSDVRSYCRRG